MLHSFPNNIHHCLTWESYEFEGLLDNTPAEANAFLSKLEECILTIKYAGDVEA
jgi:ubiquitin-activating enzyme E1